MFGVAYFRRMYGKVQRAKVLLEAGAIGRPVMAEATCHDWFHPVDGFRGWLSILSLRRRSAVRYRFASHRPDELFLRQAGARYGTISTMVHPTEVEDNATVLIEYQNRVRAMVDVRWHSRISR